MLIATPPFDINQGDQTTLVVAVKITMMIVKITIMIVCSSNGQNYKI